MVGQQHISFPTPANNGFHSPTGEKLTHAVLIRVMVQQNGTDNLAANRT
jgi:hypothetical protein